MGIFQRNLTSELLEKHALRQLEQSDNLRVLELGCGDANITRNLQRAFPQNKYFASDISEEAVEKAKILSRNLNIEYRTGSIFGPWSADKFDLIISDVASISEPLAKLSDWYDGVPCATGANGLALISTVIGHSNNYLSESGSLLVPVLSLSNYKLQLDISRKTYKKVSLMGEVRWPMPKKLVEKMVAAGIPLSCENWEISNRFSIHIAFTDVIHCSDPFGGASD
jgi:methylase of polypeptide subunit release factors